MIVVVNPSSKAGQSFKGLHAYCSHDQKRAQTSERVDWISTRNVAAEDPNHAWKVMVATAYAQNQLKQANGIRSGKAPKDGAVMHVVMSFDKDEPTSPEDMQTAADELLANLGADPAKMRAKNKPKRRQFADEHQVIMYAHSDTDNTHLHLMVNRVHPQTGVVLPTNNDHNKAQAWALKYSKRHGTDQKTPARAENDEMRKDGEYVKADKRKTRNAYEQDQKNHAASNDNKRLANVIEQQRAKDADLAKRVRALTEKKSEDFAKLIADHKKRASDLGKDLQTHINKSKATAREIYRPKFRELKEEQAAELKTFRALEKTFFGRAANSFNVVKATVKDIGGQRRGFNLKTFKSATNAGGREEYMQLAQNRARRSLELEQARKVSEATNRLKSVHATKMGENRAYLEAKRAELKQRHVDRENRLNQERQLRNAEREKAINAVPAPRPKKTDIKSKADLTRARIIYRVQFDNARQKSTSEQDNINGGKSEDQGSAQAKPKVHKKPVEIPVPVKAPEPTKNAPPLTKTYAETQRENAAKAKERRKGRGRKR